MYTNDLHLSTYVYFSQQETPDEHQADASNEEADGTENDFCLVCMEEYDEDPDITYICKVNMCEHDFHLDCLLDWLDRDSSCPQCGVSVTLSEKDISDISLSQAGHFAGERGQFGDGQDSQAPCSFLQELEELGREIVRLCAPGECFRTQQKPRKCCKSP